MITYLYWLAVFGLAVAALWLVGVMLKRWGIAVICAFVVLTVGWAAYYFHYQQVFVKRWGGVMSITLPPGQQHLGMTWKDDNLWVENYDPATNTCEFREYSRGDLLQGRVTIKNCNPFRARPAQPTSPAQQ